MDIQLVRVDINEANDLWEMQVASFLDLYEKYQDTDTRPCLKNKSCTKGQDMSN